METFKCKLCNYSTISNGNYKRHLNTNKHINKQNQYGNVLEYSKKTQKRPDKTQKDPQKTRTLGCNYCGSVFTTFAHKRRHERYRCNDIEAIKKRKILDHEKEIKELKKEHKLTIELLLSKVGTTNIITTNTTNNLNINSYGKEDMSHISDAFKTQMLSTPYNMIPKMIEQVHFNDNKPENKNILLPNKKENKIKIFTNNKWTYRSKDDILNDLIDGKYFIMDTHYETICDKIKNRKYETFRGKYEGKDKEVLDLIKKESEMVILNNR